MTKTVLITGANRGVGLTLAQVYSEKGYRVIASCRNISREMESLNGELIFDADVASDQKVKKLVAQLNGESIDVVINNAGVWGSESLSNMDFNKMLEDYNTNALGALRVVDALYTHGLLSEAAKVALITSKMGSIEDNGSGGRYAYRMSKAALNAAGKSLAIDLKSEGKAVVLIHPGWVQTDMGGKNALISAQESAKGIYKVIDHLSIETTGSFVDYKGQVIPW
ncbi:SDR family oxidoreductase [Fangia hongkongensis]|uniref:SDR family oxidoreductase n=1 Tax=Fangia hongkongensis TaxID=270495 RepID=UPI0003811525|nr:SDR family oxidoreductase [Fangia hongkongensis]MBK2126118.1 SDR family oxidoreductase [Fangia hongkongensis]